MKYFTCVLLIFLLISCKQNILQNKLQQADAINIHFYSNKKPDSIIKIVRTTSKDAIQKMISFIDSKNSKDMNCGYDGDIQFLKGEGELLFISFSAFNANCRHFTFKINNNVVNTEVSNEASDFLMALGSGKSTY